MQSIPHPGNEDGAMQAGSCAHCGFFHSTAKCPPKMNGRERYEADLLARPTYHDGTPRKTWGQLSNVQQQSWIYTGGPRSSRYLRDYSY